MWKTALRHVLTLTAALNIAAATSSACAPAGPEGAEKLAPGEDANLAEAAPPPPAASPPQAAPSASAPKELFHRTFGNKSDRPVIFLHGGPGGNSMMFEASGAADALAKRGNFVVTYDQRGSGRSPKATEADFTFERATQDLADLIHSLGITSPPVFIGHSWGGTLGVKFLEMHPNVAKGVILVGNPVDFPDSIFNIHERCTKNFEQIGAPEEVAKMSALNKRMFPNGRTPPYAFTMGDFVATMSNGLLCGLNFAKEPTAESQQLWSNLLSGPEGTKATKVEPEPGAAYQKNEHLLESEFRTQFKAAAESLYGIYGEDDGLLSAKQLEEIRAITTPAHFAIVKRASHVVFIDQQKEFIDIVSKDLDELSAKH